MNDASRKRRLYRVSPEYRQRAIQRASDNHARHARDADYLRLVQVRKDISRLRGSIKDRLAHAARLERRFNPARETARRADGQAEGEAVTLASAFHVFDEVLFDQPDYPGEPGTVRCCNVAVVMRNGSAVECLVCGRRIQEVGRQWMVTEWGTKGIKMTGWGP